MTKHWYELATDRGAMTVYFERKARGGPRAARWWLYTLRPGVTAVTAAGSPAARP